MRSIEQEALAVQMELGEMHDLHSPSEVFHENSKIRANVLARSMSAGSLAVASDGFKEYRYAPRVPLQRVDVETHPLLAAITRRRSCRRYTDEAIEGQVLSTLLQCSVGLCADRRRPSPSAGALYPLETYVFANRVQGVPAGLFHYSVRNHALSVLKAGAANAEVTPAVFAEDAASTAAATILVTGVFGRSKIKYGERAYRFVLLEAGHVVQNLCTVATALGLGSCPIGGFIDDAVNGLLDVDGVDEAALYMLTVGVPDVTPAATPATTP